MSQCRRREKQDKEFFAADRCLAENQNGKRRVVVVVRERGGRTLPAIFRTEAAATARIRARVREDSTIMADEAGMAVEAGSWNDPHARYEVSRKDHGQLYSTGAGFCANGAESFRSRMRRAEIDRHHHIAGQYLIHYARESAWREDDRRLDNGRHVRQISELAMARRPSVGFSQALAATT